MTKQEVIREGIRNKLCEFLDGYRDGLGELGIEDGVNSFLSYLHSQGVAIKVERELPYKWEVIKRKHSYRPFREFTTYALRSRFGKMFGYVQKYQSLTGYKCFEKPVYYCIYLGNAEYAHSWKSASKLKRAREMLLEQFLSSKDNPDNEIPTGYIKVKPLIEEV